MYVHMGPTYPIQSMQCEKNGAGIPLCPYLLQHHIVKAVRGMNVQICTKASNLVHRYILTCWTQICREPKQIEALPTRNMTESP